MYLIIFILESKYPGCINTIGPKTFCSREKSVHFCHGCFNLLLHGAYTTADGQDMKERSVVCKKSCLVARKYQPGVP